MRNIPRLPVFLAALLSFIFLPVVTAFSFSFDAPTQCDPVTLSWTGGTAPFYLTLIPIFGTPRNISIPDSAFSNGKGSFSTQIPLARGDQLMLAMSDATGWNAGGTTNVLTVGASKGGSCSTTQPQVPFSFQLNSDFQQCKPFIFSAYAAAALPVTIYAIIPGGNSLVFNPPVDQTSFTWNANVARGTSMVFMMVDAQGRQGGSSSIRVAGNSDDATCLNSQSPTSTSSSPAGTKPATPTTSNTSPGASSPTTSLPADEDKKGGTSVAAIVGGVIGGLILLGALISLAIFFLKRRRGDKPDSATTPWTSSRYSFAPGLQTGQGNQSEIQLTYDNSYLGGNSPYGTASSSNPYPYGPSTTALPYENNPFHDSNAPNRPPNTPHSGPQYSPFVDSPSYPQAPPVDTYHQQNPVTYPPQRHPSQSHTGALATDPFQGRPLSIPGSDFDPYATDAMEPTTPASSTQPSYAPSQPAYYGSSQYGSQPTTSPPTAQRDSMTPAQRKAAMAGASTYKPPPRFIMHTDAEDDIPPPGVDDVVELPPQYSERRAPTVPVAGSSSGKGPLP